MSKPRQQTLFQSWGKAPQSGTDSISNRASTSTGGEQAMDSDVIDLVDDMEDDELLAAVMDDFTGPDNATTTDCTPLEDLPGFDNSAGKLWIYPTNYPVRDYQYNIVHQSLLKNTLVTLPTGLGKTFIAAVVMYNFYRWYPLGKVVFMAPTKPLVAQQIEACFNIMGIPQKDTAEMTGSMPPAERKRAWQEKRVFFLTPQVMVNDLSRGACPAEDVKCLVVDEAHKALGNHAFCQVVQELIKFTSQFRVLALSATPGGDLKGVQQVLSNLLISHVELRSDDSVDIQPYTHERKVEKIVVPLGDQLKQLQNRYLAIVGVFVARLVRNKAMYARDPAKVTKFQLLKSRDLFRANPPPEAQNRVLQGCVEGDFATCISLYHGYELLLQHGMKSFYSFLNNIMEDEKGSKKKRELAQNPDFMLMMGELKDMFSPSDGSDGGRVTGLFGGQGVCTSPKTFTQRKGPSSQKPVVVSHPKLAKLEEVVNQHFQQFDNEAAGSSSQAAVKPAATRVMIFAQYRDSVQEIADILNQHRPLVRVMTFIGQASTGKVKKGFTQKEQLAVMKKFREGGYNVLVSTCVGEEGLDIGDVDLIVCFDAHKSPIRLVQRMGRTGRKRQGRIVMLVTEGKEERIYNQSQYSKKNIHKALQGSTRSLNFYMNNPRMVPLGINPAVHKMHITVGSYHCTARGKDRRGSVKGGKAPATFASAQPKGKADKDDGFLTAQELAVWNERYKLSADEATAVPTLPASRFAYLTDTTTRAQSRQPRLSMTEWSIWQNRLQPTHLVGHSQRCKNFVELMEFIDLQKDTEDEDSYEMEMKAFLNKDDIITTNPTSRGDIRNFVTESRSNKDSHTSVEKNTSVEKRRSKLFEVIETRPASSDDDLPVITLNPGTGSRDSKEVKVGKAKERKKSPRGASSLPKQKRKPLVVELDHDSDFESQEGNSKENLRANDTSCVGGTLQEEMQDMQTNGVETLASDITKHGAILEENQGYMPLDDHDDTRQECTMAAAVEDDDAEEDEESKWEAIFPTFLGKEPDAKELKIDTKRYRVPTPPSLDSFDWLEKLEQEISLCKEGDWRESQEDALTQTFPCKTSLVFEGNTCSSNTVDEKKDKVFHKEDHFGVLQYVADAEKSEKGEDNSLLQSRKEQLDSTLVSKYVLKGDVDNGTSRSMQSSRSHISNQFKIGSDMSATKDNGKHPSKSDSWTDMPQTTDVQVQEKKGEESMTIDERREEGSDNESLFGNGSDDMFAEMDIDGDVVECPEDNQEKDVAADDKEVDKTTAERGKNGPNHQYSPVSSNHPPFPTTCSPPSLFSDYEESFHVQNKEKAPQPTSFYNKDNKPVPSAVYAKTKPHVQQVEADDSLLGVDVDVGTTHTDRQQDTTQECAVNFDLGGDSILEPQFDLQFSDEDMFADLSQDSESAKNINSPGKKNETLSEGFPLPTRTNNCPVMGVIEEDTFNSIPSTPPFQRYSQVVKRCTHVQNQQADYSPHGNRNNVEDEFGHEDMFSEGDMVASTPVHGPGRFASRLSLRGSTKDTKDSLVSTGTDQDQYSPKASCVMKGHLSGTVQKGKKKSAATALNGGLKAGKSKTPDEENTDTRRSKPGAADTTWSCPTCTFLNHALLSTCEICDSPKAATVPDTPKAAAMSSDSDEDEPVVKRKRSRAQVLTSPEASPVRAQVLTSPETSPVRAQVLTSPETSPVRAQLLTSPDTSPVEDTSGTPVGKRAAGKGLRNRVLDTTAEDSDSDFDLPSQTKHKHSKQVSRHNTQWDRDVAIARRKAKSRRHAARGFLEEEAELSEEEGEFVSSDEDEEGEDSNLEGFVSYSSQCTQATTEEEMRAVYLQSVRSPVLHGGRGYKLVKKPWNPDVFSQVPEPDVDDYEQDSFCVGDDEEVLPAECTVAEPAEDWDSPVMGQGRTRRQKRLAALEDTPERKQQGQPKGKRKRIVMVDTSSEDDSPAPNKHQAKDTTTPSRTEDKTGEQAFKTPVGRPPARRSLIGQTSGRREISSTMANDVEDNEDDFETSRMNRGLYNQGREERRQGNSLFSHTSNRNASITHGKEQEEIVSTQRLEMSLAERLKIKQASVSRGSKDNIKQHANVSRLSSGPESVGRDSREDLTRSKTVQLSNMKVESSNNVEHSSTRTSGMEERRPEPSPRMMNTTIFTPRSVTSRNLGKLVVLVDSREIASSQQVVSSLRFHHDINAVVCQLGSCDYLLSNRMGVERKTLSDFCSSTNREKLVQRVQELCELFDKPCLVVEKDRVKPGMEPKKARTPTKYHSSVLAALAHTSVTVLFTDTQEQTASLLSELARLEQRKGNCVQGSPEVGPEGEQMLKVYLSMPGIHYATALNLYYNCGGLTELLKCTAMQLQMKGKMSLQKASTLHQFLRHNFNPQMLADK